MRTHVRRALLSIVLLLAAAIAGGGFLAPSRVLGQDARPDGTWRRLPPPSSANLPTFVDPATGRLWIQTDYDGEEFWTFDLKGSEGWTRVPVPGINVGSSYYEWEDPLFDRATRRLIRIGHGVTYDSLGAYQGPLDVWSLPLDAPRWSRLEIAGPLPSSRNLPALCVDEAGGRMFLVGGYLYDGFREQLLGDVWSLQLGTPPSWQELVVTGSRGNGFGGGSMFYEPEERRLVLIGARDSLVDDFVSDTYRVQALNVEGAPSWVTLPSTTPPEYSGFRAWAYDPTANRMLVLHRGFLNEPAESTYLYSFDGRGDGSWNTIPMPGGPHGDFETPICVDPGTNSVVLFGSRGAPGTQAFYPRADVWVGTGDGQTPWERRFTSISSNAVRIRGATVFDPNRRRLVTIESLRPRNLPAVFVYRIDPPQSWEAIECVGPGPSTERDAEALVFDPVGDRMLLFGGGRDGAEFGDLWELSFAVSPPSWRRILTEGDSPSPRSGSSAIYDPLRRRMVLFGGYAGEDLADTWELDLSVAEPRWKEVVTRGGPPPARREHTAVYDSKRNGMIVFGGATGPELSPTPRNDAWLLSFVDCDAWVPIPLGSAPPMPRYEHGAMYDSRGDRMIVLGGRDRNGLRFDRLALDLGTPSRWTVLHPTGVGPLTERFPSLAYDEVTDRMLHVLQNSAGEVHVLDWGRAGTEPLDPIVGSGTFRILGVGPNPSRGDVTIAFEVPRTTTIEARLYDVRGRLVRDLGSSVYQPGPHILCWNGRDEGGQRLRDGVYFARIVVEGKAVSGKIVLMD